MQPSSNDPAQSLYSFISLDSIDLSTTVEEDPSIMNKDLCATSEEHEVVSPCMILTVGPPDRNMNKPSLLLHELRSLLKNELKSELSCGLKSEFVSEFNGKL